MGDYIFRGYTSSAFVADPVFNNKDFEMFGNCGAYNTPILFEVGDYRYVLSKPYQMKEDASLLFKIAAYLFHHPTKSNAKPITYFFGDINLCKDIGKDFTNQIKKIVSLEMLDEWMPKNITEINNRIVNYFFGQTNLLWSGI